MRKKLSIDYNIPEDEIIIINPQKGSYRVQVIYETNDFHDKNFDVNNLKRSCSNEEFKELQSLKEIYSRQ